MKIIIELKDQENNHVKIDCKPPIPKLIESYKNGQTTPAMVYAVLGLQKMMGDSEQIEKEQEKEARERVAMQGIILPWQERKEMGPQDVN